MGRWLALGACAIVGLALTCVALFVVFTRNPDGGEPIATAMIEKRAAPPVIGAAPPAASAEPRAQSSARQLEAESGVVVVRQGAEAPGAIVITIPDSDAPAKLAPAPDSRLIERTRHGMLPRIGPG
ncbi:MAG: divergent polysaccharide deacetylase family protein, partial [Bosea sp. (in: a-proteobacteria)]